MNVVGLFGTCGSSTWREDVVIPILESSGVSFFNPVVDDWDEECMKIEAEHAANDKVVLLAITKDTTGIGSMAESGWIALQAVQRNQNLIIVLEDMLEDSLDALRINKARKLIKSHINQIPEGNVFLFETLEDAAQKAVEIMKK